MLDAIFGLIQTIVCILENLVLSILAVIIMGFNAIISGLAAAVAAAVALLPTMPDPPDWSTVPWMHDAFGFANWFFPFNFLLSTLLIAAALWIGVQGIAVILRWVKATNQ